MTYPTDSYEHVRFEAYVGPSREQALFDALRDAQRRCRVVEAAHAADPSSLTAAAVEAAADAELEAEVALNAEVGRG